jgi:hypothetical protein
VDEYSFVIFETVYFGPFPVADFYQKMYHANRRLHLNLLEGTSCIEEDVA